MAYIKNLKTIFKKVYSDVLVSTKKITCTVCAGTQIIGGAAFAQPSQIVDRPGGEILGIASRMAGQAETIESADKIHGQKIKKLESEISDIEKVLQGLNPRSKDYESEKLSLDLAHYDAAQKLTKEEEEKRIKFAKCLDNLSDDLVDMRNAFQHYKVDNSDAKHVDENVRGTLKQFATVAESIFNSMKSPKSKKALACLIALNHSQTDFNIYIDRATKIIDDLAIALAEANMTLDTQTIELHNQGVKIEHATDIRVVGETIKTVKGAITSALSPVNSGLVKRINISIDDNFSEIETSSLSVSNDYESDQVIKRFMQDNY